MSASESFQINVGVGSILLNGQNHNSGLSFTAPIFIYPNQTYGFRLYPTWSFINGNEIDDYDGSIEFVHKYYSLRLGYRRSGTNEKVLGGPYVGFTVFY